MSLKQRIHGFLHPNAQARVVTPSGSLGGGTKVPAHAAGASALRRRPTMHLHGTLIRNDQPPKRGMWVVYQQRTGILTMLELGDVATVMLVDELGLNAIEVHVPAKDLRQAWFEEIPEPRRPPYEDAVRFGYHARPA